jgi:hypothetical protein
MATRINARHITCPGCQEEVFMEELVGGRCPLCGCELDGSDESCEGFEDLLDRSDLTWLVYQYFLFRKFEALGVSPLQTLHLISRFDNPPGSGPSYPEETPYSLETPFSFWERLVPKRCSRCGRIFLTGGRRLVTGDLGHTSQVISYLCPSC